MKIIFFGSFYRVFGPETKSNLELLEFLRAVGQLKFRGTSSLFRLKQASGKKLNSDQGYVDID